MSKSDWGHRRRVGVIGGSQPDAASRQNAETMGRLIAENDYILVNGGLGGVMEASARGAKSSGGLVIGILPGTSLNESNEFTDISIPTGMGHMRNSVVVLNSEILVAIDGSYGTLSEIAFAKLFNRTVLGLDTWDIDGVVSMASPEEVIKEIKRLLH